MNPEELKAQAQLAKLRELENTEEFRRNKKESDTKTLATLAAATAK